MYIHAGRWILHLPIFQAGHEGSIPFARSHPPGPGQSLYRPPEGLLLRTLTNSFVPTTCHCRAPLGQRSSPRAGLVRVVDRLTLADLLVKLLTMTTLPLGEVKTHLSELVGRVHDHHERVTVTVHGRPSAVLVAVEDLERLEETLAIMRDADTIRRLAESDAELARGEEVTAAELAETIRNRSAHE